MPRNRHTFTSDNNPRKRKIPLDLDRGAIDAKEIDKVIAETPAERRTPRPCSRRPPTATAAKPSASLPGS